MRARLRQRRSAAVVLWAMGLIALAHLAWSLLGDQPALQDGEYGARLEQLQQCLQELPNRKLVLALGSSRLLMGLAADDIPSSGPLLFNMGITAAGPANELIMLRRVLDQGIRPRAVVIEVLPRALSGPGHALQEAVKDQRRSPRDRDVLPAAEHRSWWRDALTPPWWAQRFGLVQRLVPTWMPPQQREEWYATTAYGWLPWTGVPSPESRAGHLQRTRIEYADHLSFTEINDKADQLLRRIFKVCRQQEIEVLAVVSMPESSEFRSWYGPGTRETLVRYLTVLCLEYGARYVNAADWIADSDFADGHHLLPPGAHLFTARLWQEVLQPWTARQ
jgi:hypothetical protein